PGGLVETSRWQAQRSHRIRIPDVLCPGGAMDKRFVAAFQRSIRSTVPPGRNLSHVYPVAALRLPPANFLCPSGTLFDLALNTYFGPRYKSPRTPLNLAHSNGTMQPLCRVSLSQVVCRAR